MTGVYERIELPPVNAHITRVERYGGTCPECQKRYESPVPVALEPGSPFGPRIAALVTYLRYHHGVSYGRLSHLMADLYGLATSEGAIANLLCRVQRQLDALVNQILERLRSARLVCSDETGARVEGRTQWEWVFQNGQYCLRFRGALREILNLHPKHPEAERLLKRYQKLREHLLLFLDDETIPPTNNSSEQALRWSVVFRKVTHGFRSTWGADLFAQGQHTAHHRWAEKATVCLARVRSYQGEGAIASSISPRRSNSW